MPRLYRSMRVDHDGLPTVGPTARSLGVRTDDDPPRLYFDVRVDPGDGSVSPGAGGLSVAPDDPQNLPFHRRPERLGGGGDDPVFAIDDTSLGSDLLYRPDPRQPSNHGFIEPSRRMSISEYQNALATTRSAWIRID